MGMNPVGVCGLFCGACDNYLAFQKGHAHLLNAEKFTGDDPEKLRCSGCRSGYLTGHCLDCGIRRCASGRGVAVCSECGEYPCRQLAEFREGGFHWAGAAHRRSLYWSLSQYAEEGEGSWLRYQKRRWSCRCGKPFSFYEKVCSSCGELLDSCAAEPSKE